MSDPSPPSYPDYLAPSSSSTSGTPLPSSSNSEYDSPLPLPPDSSSPLACKDEIAFVAFSSRSSREWRRPSSPSQPASLASSSFLSSSFPSSSLIDLTGLNNSKPKLHIVLAERMQFVQPPVGFYATDGTYQVREEGRINRSMGFCHISLPERKLVKSLSIKFEANQRLIFPDGIRSRWEESVVFSKEVVYDGTGLETFVKGKDREQDKKGSFYLEKGVSSFEFLIQIPSTSPCHDYCWIGRVRWDVTATAELEKPFSKGSLLSMLAGGSSVGLLEDKQQMYLYALPSDEHEPQFSVADRFNDPVFGLFDFSMMASTLTVAGPLFINFTILSLPPDLTIFAIRASVQQTVRLSAPPDRKAAVLGVQSTVARAGPKSGWEQPGFVQRTRKAKKGDKEGTVLDTRSGGDDAGLVGQRWNWEKMGRMPSSNGLRPTTEPGTQTSLRFSTELAVEVCYNTAEDESVRVATIFQQRVRVGSCCSTLSDLLVPDYSVISQDISRKISWKQPPTHPCRCDETWEKIEQDERAYLKVQGPRLSFDADPRVPRASVSAEEAERERERKVGELSEADWTRRRESMGRKACT